MEYGATSGRRARSNGVVRVNQIIRDISRQRQNNIRGSGLRGGRGRSRSCRGSVGGRQSGPEGNSVAGQEEDITEEPVVGGRRRQSRTGTVRNSDTGLRNDELVTDERNGVEVTMPEQNVNRRSNISVRVSFSSNHRIPQSIRRDFLTSFKDTFEVDWYLVAFELNMHPESLSLAHLQSGFSFKTFVTFNQVREHLEHNFSDQGMIAMDLRAIRDKRAYQRYCSKFDCALLHSCKVDELHQYTKVMRNISLMGIRADLAHVHGHRTAMAYLNRAFEAVRKAIMPLFGGWHFDYVVPIGWPRLVADHLQRFLEDEDDDVRLKRHVFIYGPPNVGKSKLAHIFFTSQDRIDKVRIFHPPPGKYPFTNFDQDVAECIIFDEFLPEYYKENIQVLNPLLSGDTASIDPKLRNDQVQVIWRKPIIIISNHDVDAFEPTLATRVERIFADVCIPDLIREYCRHSGEDPSKYHFNWNGRDMPPRAHDPAYDMYLNSLRRLEMSRRAANAQDAILDNIINEGGGGSPEAGTTHNDTVRDNAVNDMNVRFGSVSEGLPSGGNNRPTSEDEDDPLVNSLIDDGRVEGVCLALNPVVVEGSPIGVSWRHLARTISDSDKSVILQSSTTSSRNRKKKYNFDNAQLGMAKSPASPQLRGRIHSSRHDLLDCRSETTWSRETSPVGSVSSSTLYGSVVSMCPPMSPVSVSSCRSVRSKAQEATIQDEPHSGRVSRKQAPVMSKSSLSRRCQLRKQGALNVRDNSMPRSIQPSSALGLRSDKSSTSSPICKRRSTVLKQSPKNRDLSSTSSTSLNVSLAGSSFDGAVPLPSFGVCSGISYTPISGHGVCADNQFSCMNQLPDAPGLISNSGINPNWPPVLDHGRSRSYSPLIGAMNFGCYSQPGGALAQTLVPQGPIIYPTPYATWNPMFSMIHAQPPLSSSVTYVNDSPLGNSAAGEVNEPLINVEESDHDS